MVCASQEKWIFLEHVLLWRCKGLAGQIWCEQMPKADYCWIPGSACVAASSHQCMLEFRHPLLGLYFMKNRIIRLLCCSCFPHHVLPESRWGKILPHFISSALDDSAACESPLHKAVLFCIYRINTKSNTVFLETACMAGNKVTGPAYDSWIWNIVVGAGLQSGVPLYGKTQANVSCSVPSLQTQIWIVSTHAHMYSRLPA